MSLSACIPELIEQGKIPKAKAKAARMAYDRLLAVYDQQMGDDAAKAAATAGTIRQLEIEAALKKRQVLLGIAAQKRMAADLAGYDGGKGAAGGVISPRAAEALFDQDGRASYSNVEARRKAIRGRAHAMIDGILAKHRKTMLGVVRDPADLDDLVRAARGEAVQNVSARELGDAFTQMSEMLRQRFNAAGGNIGKLEGWFPQSHDSRAVRNAGFDAWRDFIVPRLDRDRMIYRETGLPFTDDQLDRVLRDVFETVRTDGWSKVTPGSATGAGALANQNAEHRFLQFASADDWLAYNQRFGQGNAFDAMMSHVDAMSRDIALMEILGPNPDASVRWLKDNLQKTAAIAGDDAGKATDAAHAGANRVQRLYDEITGNLRRPESRRIALGFSALRSFQTSAKLGSALISATTDLGFQTFTRKFNGLPAVSTLTDYLKLLRPGAMEDRRLAVRMGLIAEEWANGSASQHRYLNEELTGEVARRMAEFTLRASGLAHFTQSGRWAFGMEFAGHITGEAEKSFDNLDPAFARVLQRYGIGAGEWDSIRATPQVTERGAQWIMPQDIADARLGDRVLEMILTETDFAVPTADLRTRAMFSSVAPRGTIIGEAVRSALLFKSFGVSMLLTHGRRAMEQPGWNKAAYAAGLLIPLTLMGGMALQLKEVSKGKDPRPIGIDDPAEAAKFWGAAMLQGGGFGIFGDFLSSSENRFGGGLVGTLAGPLWQSGANVADLTVGNAMKAARGDKTDVGKDIHKLLRSEVPVASSLWYTRLAFERLALDQLQEQVDPNYRQSWRRMEKRARETGQDYFWRPGEFAPEGAPDFSNIFEETAQ